MSTLQKEIDSMLELLPDSEQKLAYEFINQFFASALFLLGTVIIQRSPRRKENSWNRQKKAVLFPKMKSTGTI